MADILIRGMEMPKDGRITIQIGADGAVYFVEKCTIMAEKYEKSSHAVPLPEGHGRLIDAGSLYDRLENTLTHFIKVKSYTESQKYAFGYCEAWNDAKAVLTNAPTIVPAEGGMKDG